MCDHQPREAAMVVTHRNEAGEPTVWCDPCLEPLIRALNDGGLPTIASCCGHGLLPGNVILKDGRCLLLLPSYQDAAWMEERWLDGGPTEDPETGDCDYCDNHDVAVRPYTCDSLICRRCAEVEARWLAERGR